MSPSTETRENREFASEIKFVIAPALAEQICDWTHGRLAPDPNASVKEEEAYQISSLYFDTEQFDVFHRKGSFGRSKLRIRRYGTGDIAFLERKLKTRGLVTKRRAIVQISELQRLTGGHPESGWAGYWFHRRLLARHLKTVAQISYFRTARVAMTSGGPIRLTLDHDVRAVPAIDFGFSHTTTGTRLQENQVILELKFLFQMPALFKQLVEEFALTPQPVSKYRLAAVALGLAAQVETEPPKILQSNASLSLAL